MPKGKGYPGGMKRKPVKAKTVKKSDSGKAKRASASHKGVAKRV